MLITGNGEKTVQIWYITKYDTSRWKDQPVIFEHYDFRDGSEYLSEYHIVPILAIKPEGTPVDRFRELLMILQQRYPRDTSSFYLTECEVPKSMIKGNKKVLLPYIAFVWVRGITKFDFVDSSDGFNYNCEVLYENVCRALLSGVNNIKYDKKSIEIALNNVKQIRDSSTASLCEITNMDMLKSIIIRAKDFKEGSKEITEILPRIRQDINKDEVVCFIGRKKASLDYVYLTSYEYLWHMYYGYKREVVKEYKVDVENTQKYILDANKMLKRKEKEDEKRKEKERIRSEKEEIERKKAKYGEDKVDDRIKQDEDSFGWWAQWFANKITFGRVAPPKTLRSEDYRKEFIKHNPGLFINGLYFCIYCGRPILADTQNKNKKMYVDHIKPINQGGRNSVWNLGPACLKCNTAKSDKGGEWVISGYLGKIGFSAVQAVSSISKTLLFGMSSKSKIKKVISAGFYITTGLWMLKLLF